MRENVRVKMSADQLTVLEAVLPLLPQGSAKTCLELFLTNARADFEDMPGKAIEVARREYANDELEVDDDAPLSRADDGLWVGAWVWVSNEEMSPEYDDSNDVAH